MYIEFKNRQIESMVLEFRKQLFFGMGSGNYWEVTGRCFSDAGNAWLFDPDGGDVSVFTVPSFIFPYRCDLCTFLRYVIHQPKVYWLFDATWSKTPTSWTEGLHLNETHFHRKTKVNQNLYEIYIIFIFFSISFSFFFFAHWSFLFPFSFSQHEKGTMYSFPCCLIFISFLSP